MNMKYGRPAECVCKRREGRWKERRKRDEKEKEKEWGVHPMILTIHVHSIRPWLEERERK